MKMSLPENETMVNLKKSFFCRNYAFTRGFDSFSITNEALVAFWREFHFNYMYQTCVKDN